MIKFISIRTSSLIIVIGVACYIINKSIVLNMPFFLRVKEVCANKVVSIFQDLISKIIKSIIGGLLPSHYLVRYQLIDNDSRSHGKFILI